MRPGFRPQGGVPTGFRPPMQPGLPRPGFQSPNGAGTPVPPGVRPGFPPHNQSRPLMRPVGQSPLQSPAPRPVGTSPVGAPSPVQQQRQLPQEPPLSPTAPTAETHRRKRMYPEQITKAYSGDVPVSPGYPQQPQPQAYGSPAMSTQQQPQQPQQQQFISPMGTPNAAAASPYGQPQQTSPTTYATKSRLWSTTTTATSLQRVQPRSCQSNVLSVWKYECWFYCPCKSTFIKMNTVFLFSSIVNYRSHLLFHCWVLVLKLQILDIQVLRFIYHPT